ncbi:TetR/AcrR family transcriptional regulator [Magnetococcus sp. PR-3]|uniref:TetR/AcrR family transcriptional regulator n=1 Tax=Magnetococcus sp. PR-3 TaxID=3120355 RepID=UPI002FCDF42B
METLIDTNATQGRVLQAALTLFSQQGYFATSMQQLQKEAGVSIGSIYHHFGSKEAIAQALYDTLLARMNTAVDERIAQHKDHHGRFRALIEMLFEMTEQDPMAMGFILNARHREFLPTSPPICSSRPFQQMKQLVEQAMAEGMIKPIEPWVAAAQMFGGALRLIHLHLDDVLGQPLPTLTDETFRAAWNGLAYNPLQREKICG